MIIDWGPKPGYAGPILGPTFAWASGGSSGAPNFVYDGDIALTTAVASPTTGPADAHEYVGSVTLTVIISTQLPLTSVNDDGLGIIRYLGEISNAEVLISLTDGFGDLVQVDGIHTFDDFGIIGPVYNENLSLRIEYRRRGKELSEEQPFEIPDRYTTYLRHYVLARALEREGPGQDLVLSAHFQSRWEAGIARMMKRKNAMSFQKAQVMGGSNSVRGQKPPRPRLPWQFGTVVK